MISYLKKIIFKLTKPQTIIFAGGGFSVFTALAGKIFKESKIKFFYFSEEINIGFILKNSSSVVLIINDAEAGLLEKIKDTALKIPSSGFLILNSDKISLNGVKNKISAKTISYGLIKEADFKATDIGEVDGNINFKINRKGDSVPFWIKSNSKETVIEIILACAAVGVSKDLNLVEISQLLKP